MRKILRGLVVATALTLPLSATAISTAPAQASEARVAHVAPAAAAPKAKPMRQFSIKDLPGRQAKLRIFVKPDFKNKPIIIQTRKNGKFRTTGKVRTNSHGVAIRVFAGSARGIRYRLIAVGGTKYATSGVSFTITRTRF